MLGWPTWLHAASQLLIKNYSKNQSFGHVCLQISKHFITLIYNNLPKVTWALIQSLLKTKRSLYWLQRALDWTHNESLHSKQKNQEQKTWSKQEMSFSPSLPQFTEKDGYTRFIFPVLLYHTDSLMKGLWSLSRLALFLGSLFNSKNPLTQSNTRVHLHFSGIFKTLTLSNTSMRAAHKSATGESYVNVCQLRIVPQELDGTLAPE